MPFLAAVDFATLGTCKKAWRDERGLCIVLLERFSKSIQREWGAMPASATMKDVAAAAGVSPSTVSNAYNKPEQLSAEVRHRILAKARELGYPGPDAAARSLRSRRAGAIGLLLTEQLSYAFSDP